MSLSMYNSTHTHYCVCSLMYTHTLIKQLQLGNIHTIYNLKCKPVSCHKFKFMFILNQYFAVET